MALRSINDAPVSPIEAEDAENIAYLAELADRIRAEGPAALDSPEYADLFIDDITIDEFIAELLEQFPADDATLPAAA